MANEVRLIGCRSCDSKNCSGCNLLTLEEMLHKGEFDCLMDESRSIVATPESLRPKGRWFEMIETKEDGYTGEYYEDVYYNCINCDYASDWNSPYCPNCGADMRGEG